MSSNIEELTKAIKQIHGYDARHVESVPVVEKVREKVVWQGQVEVFDITGNKSAKRCYAWSVPEGDEGQHVIMFHCEPIATPLDAVRAFIAGKFKSR